MEGKGVEERDDKRGSARERERDRDRDRKKRERIKFVINTIVFV